MEKIHRKIVIVLIISMLSALNNCSPPDYDNSIVLLPANFSGPVVIVYEQADSGSIETVEGKTLLRVSESGICFTSDSDHFGEYNFTTFFEDTITTSNQLDFALTSDQLLNDRKMVSGGSVSRISRSRDKKSDIKYITYCVGWKDEIRQCEVTLDTLNVERLLSMRLFSE